MQGDMGGTDYVTHHGSVTVVFVGRGVGLRLVCDLETYDLSASLMWAPSGPMGRRLKCLAFCSIACCSRRAPSPPNIPRRLPCCCRAFRSFPCSSWS